MASAQEIILLFTKYPRPGTCKTRLIPTLGAHKAADLQRFMTQTILNKIELFSKRYPCETVICYEGGALPAMRAWLGASHVFKKQQGLDLGERMFSALAEHLDDSRALLLVGSDCPDIDDTILESGFTALLSDRKVVLGPAFDGGYYLIGVQGGLARDHLRSFFKDIDWGTPRVLTQTIARIEALGYSCHLLEKLHDIDTPDDLLHLCHYSGT